MKWTFGGLICGLLAVVAAGVLVGTAAGQIPEGFEVVRLATTHNLFTAPHINNAGTVVWNERLSTLVSKVYRYRDGQIEQVTAGFGFEDFPQIDDLGRVAWLSGATGFDPKIVTVLDASGANVLPGEPAALDMTLGNGGQVIWTQSFGDPNNNH